MATKDCQTVAPARIPQAHRTVPPAASDSVSVGTEGHTSNRGCVPLQDGDASLAQVESKAAAAAKPARGWTDSPPPP